MLWCDEDFFYVSGFDHKQYCYFWAENHPGNTIEKMESLILAKYLATTCFYLTVYES